jgi:uncharacterized protein (DUF58 family)
MGEEMKGSGVVLLSREIWIPGSKTRRQDQRHSAEIQGMQRAKWSRNLFLKQRSASVVLSTSLKVTQSQKRRTTYLMYYHQIL